MSEQEREKVSALVDDELSEHEISRHIGRLLETPSEQQTWARYHLIGDAMRQELGSLVQPDLASAISASLEHEPIIIAPGMVKRRPASWLKPVAGTAIAASVALVAVTMVPQLINDDPVATLSPTVAVKKPPVETIYSQSGGTRWELLARPDVETKLNSYLVNHQEYAPANTMKGIMPYATFVSYDVAK
ncbi:sigma-E factor negative regulatory protein [endosymbiont of Ridgeia piscesae]|jgi:sigma-E factor negative regulatory protein RseA|uniref:Anti sigma-E protein RseA, N-terminal domain n=1 Tax=endosymbiont of Ridgeia piscesae TaxID=54398 RepID=A0A0T5Z061_9GAMM|nr:sigma-E factor negative regulatory protein [endosymbiont of Ridgeia piscesae]KRT56208.1 Anti sigma-E protein RseA, N-terminal domain [endosymbiont of Ridgeia piscesae]KRT59513.1 anti sigma-E protein, RseA [endosymbiont of Ridgeia piscesae]